MQATRLDHLVVISALGVDAGTFLQGQLTQDVLALNERRAAPAGYCSPKGRLLGSFLLLHPVEVRYLLVCRRDVAEALVRRLRMFVLRAKCLIEIAPDLHVWGLDNPTPLPPWTALTELDVSLVSLPDGRTLWIGPADRQPTPPADEAQHRAQQERWRWQDISMGLPWVEAATVDAFVPQMVNLELVGGVSFRKGCYPGQEVVARSQYRGTLKRRMFLLACPAGTQAAQEIFHSADPSQPSGLVVNAADDASGARALVELKIAAWGNGSLHLGSIDGPLLQPLALPYDVPLEQAA